ncbi:polymorphic toxin-type HINT domain-containing protein [Amycolatopsis sp. NPDC059657]|uniref:golvesin C-terminal-like domain-containing protein n=1 Tax=Amycolatopsis sp. NPDC059657 TaxID=3346899 RepID=UPI003670CB58
MARVLLPVLVTAGLSVITPPAMAATAAATPLVPPPSPRCAATAALAAAPSGGAPAPEAMKAAARKARATDSAAYAAPETARRMIPSNAYHSAVTLTNTTAAAFPAATKVLSYHWTRPNGEDATTAANRKETRLPADLAPGASVTLDGLIQAPALGDISNEREQFSLRWDIYDTAAKTWLADTAQVPTLDQDVRVETPTSDQLGLESFYSYSSVKTGGGGTASVNQFSGNAVWGHDVFTNPSRGPSSFVRLNYNSKDTSNAYGGPGWSIAASTLNRLGTPLAFDGAAGSGWAQTVVLTDGDGTSHRWDLDKRGSTDPANWVYDSPAGVNLYLRYLPDNPNDRKWVFTAPERTDFFFDTDGYHTATVDKNGNTMSFAYGRVIIGNRNSGVLRAVTDAAGRRTLTFDYYQEGLPAAVVEGDKKHPVAKLAVPAIVNQLKSITDVSGRVVNLVYGDNGALREIDDAVGTPDQKTYQFFYGTTGTTVNKLIRTVDPLGRSTGIDYFTDQADALRFGKARVITDRRNAATGFDYSDPDGAAGPDISSVVTDGNGHASRFRLDGYGRLTASTDALNRTTTLVWDADNNVVRLTENNGATKAWFYDPKTGFPLEIRDAEAVRQNTPPTVLTYRYALDGYVADLTGKTTPEGRRWQFVYDENGNLVAVTDPKGTATPDPNDYTSRYSYDELGHLINQVDANGHATVYGDYDAVGYPNMIVDALGCTTRYRYDAVGNPVSTMDARGKVGTTSYDIFKRPLDSKLPKDEAAGVYITTPGPRYDANDNVITATDARGSVTRTVYDEMDRTVAVYAPKDTPDGPEKLTTLSYDAVGNVIGMTKPKGNLTAQDPNDFTESLRYDEVNQRVETKDVNGDRIIAAFDDVGNMVTKYDPRANRTPDLNDYATKWVFDQNHQVISTIDPLGNSTRTRYDRDGNVVGNTDEDGNETLITLDERAKQTEVRSPHDKSGSVQYFTTRYEYDQVGNKTRTTNPRGADTPNVADDFVAETIYDELNRKRAEILPYDPADADAKAAVGTIYTYDELGRVTEISAPPSHGSGARTVTRQSYYDNGWIRSSNDAFDIDTSYDYNETGQQTVRSVSGSGGASARTQTWTYYPSGKQRSRSDTGVPVGAASVLVDNADARRTYADDGWSVAQSPKGYQGTQYSTITTKGEEDYFTWKASIPRSGRYDVQVWYPEGTATNATYYIKHDGGNAEVVIDQSKNQGRWVSLGKFAFTEGDTREIVLAGESNGTVTADAVKLVRDTTGEPDTENKTFTMSYDPNDNMTKMADSSPGAPADTWDIGYDEVDLADSIKESKAGKVLHTTTYGYDENDNIISTRMDGHSATYTYDSRDLVSSIVNKRNDGESGKTTTFSYDKQAHVTRQVKGNGNVLEATYYLDGLLKRQTEKKKNSSTVVADHQLTYDANSNKTRDTGTMQNADNGGSMSFTKNYTYDPRDRIRKVTKSGSAGGATEQYRNDDNGNVYDQTVDGVHTTFEYDRNRLQSSKRDGTESDYDYDAYGRLDHVSQNGETTERYTYDGFDRKTKLVKDKDDDGQPAKTTLYTYDPLDRQTSKTEDATGDKRVTNTHYLGLTQQVLTEDVKNKLSKIYQYSPDGEMLGQIRFGDDGNGSAEDVYMGFNTRSDVEQVTDKNGNTKSTYGYTAYGEEDLKQSTGDDKTEPANPDKPEKNSYRFNTARHDKSSDSYDMGFRDYSPGTNRFLTLDLYNGSLFDLGMSVDPWTSNRYTFGAGNPLSQVELDGHGWFDDAVGFIEQHADVGHLILDVASNIPVVGSAAAVINGAWYAAEGDVANSVMSFASAVPGAAVVASAVKLGKAAVKGAEAVQTINGATKAASAAIREEKIASQAAAKGLNDAKTAPTPTPAPKGPGGTATTAPPGKGAPSGAGQGGGPAANGGGTSATGKAPRCLLNSFVPGTRVVMADGTTKPIEDVKAGDLVAATNPTPGAGTFEAQPVTAAYTSTGSKSLVEITIDTDGEAGAATGTVVTTDNHPFWVDDRGRWIVAADLHPGDLLRSATGRRLLVASVRGWTQRQQVHNLTVAGVHTFYVLVDATAILVHNGRPPRQYPDPNAEGWPHTTFQRQGDTGEVKKYAEWGPPADPRDKRPIVLQKRFDRYGPEHTNPDGAKIDTPHINMPNDGPARKPETWEKPQGCP